MTNTSRIKGMFFTVAAFALVVLGTASARTQVPGKYGGTLVVGVSGFPDTLDPTLSRGLAAIVVYNSYCEQLYDFDARSRIVPQLAAALPVVSKDKLIYTIPLRQGIEFNDGTPFNAQAVVTTLQRMISLPGSTRSGELSSIASVTASGPFTVVIQLKTQFTPLTATLALPDGVVLSPTQIAKLGADFETDPVCVGPFMFDHQVAGDNVTVIKSPYYYDQKDVHLDKIVFKPFPDAAAATAALQAGDIQVLDGFNPTALPGIQQSTGLRFLHAYGLGWRGIIINIGNKNGCCVPGHSPYTNVGTPLASSPKLRQAFEEAIDRNAMNKVVYAGTTQTGCTPMSPASPTFDASFRCTPYDPSDAKRLVAQSGFPNPTVHLLTGSQTDQIQLAQFIQAEEAAVGINVVIDVGSATSTALSGNFDTFIQGPAGGTSTDQAINDWVATSGSRDYGGYSNPRLDLILANTHKATTPKALTTLYHAAQQILLNDRPIIFLLHSVRYAAVSSSVTGVQLRPDLLLRVAFAQYK